MNQTSIALVLGCALLAGCRGNTDSAPPAQNGDADGNAQLSGEDSAPFSDQSGRESSTDDGPGPNDTFQTPEEAAAQDAMLIAAARGWTLEQYAVFQAGVDALGAVQGRVAREHPEMFVGGAVGPEHDAPPRLYIKGSADDFVRGLVAAAPVEIAVIDGQPLSSDEIEARNSAVSAVLSELGFEHHSVSSDIEREAMLEIGVVPAPGAPETPEALRAALPPEYRQRVEITFFDSGFEQE